jgi:hypothetical protein
VATDNLMKKDSLIKVVSCLFVFALYSIVLLEDETLRTLRGEDKFIENLGALYFLTASILYFANFLQSSGSGQSENCSRLKKNHCYLFFGALFFLGFGEEISWGQRLMDWESPQLFQNINKHKETNLHNLNIFGKGILRPDIWFFVFWFSYCLILPTISKYSMESRNVISRFGLPVPPLWIGYLLLTNFVIYCISLLFPSDWPLAHKFAAYLEIKESNAAFIFAVLAFHELRKQSFEKKES